MNRKGIDGFLYRNSKKVKNRYVRQRKSQNTILSDPITILKSSRKQLELEGNYVV